MSHSEMQFFFQISPYEESPWIIWHHFYNFAFLPFALIKKVFKGHKVSFKFFLEFPMFLLKLINLFFILLNLEGVFSFWSTASDRSGTISSIKLESVWIPIENVLERFILDFVLLPRDGSKKIKIYANHKHIL